MLGIGCMSTVVEIEEAIGQLPTSEQEALFRHLQEAMRLREKPRFLPMVPPTGQTITQQEIDDALDAD